MIPLSPCTHSINTATVRKSRGEDLPLPQIIEASPTTCVVMLTGFGSDAIRRQAHELGASAYLEKGASSEAILAALTLACADTAR